MTENIWKLDWNPQGVEETFTLDTTGCSKGDVLPLKRTFFKGENIKFLLPKGDPLVVSDIDDSVDIILYNKELRLSDMAGTGIYESVRLGKRACNKVLTVTATFVADRIDSKSFNQELNQDSDVVHYSMDTLINTTKEFYTSFARVDERLELPCGSITADGVQFTCSDMSLGSMTFGDKGITSKTGEAGLYCDEGHLKFDKETKSWVRFLPSTGEEASLISFFSKSVPYGGIPITNLADPSTLTFVDWFTTDPDNRKVIAKNFQTEKLESDTTVTKELTIGEHVIRQDQQGDLDIDGVLKINKATGVVTIGFVSFTTENLLALQALLNDRR